MCIIIIINSWRSKLQGVLVNAPPPPPLSLSLALRAPARGQASGERGEQTSGSRGKRKMELRVGERLLCVAALSSLLCVDSVLGKYVRGVVNTKEVSPLPLLADGAT